MNDAEPVFEHPEDHWYQIEALGDHPNTDAAIIQKIDRPAAVSIVKNFNALADKPGFPGMPIDHDHFQHDPKQETTAYGWLMKLQARSDGIYGQIRWSATGQKAVDGGDYRFFSTEYESSDMQPVGNGKPATVRPLKLAGLSLTNANNNKGQKPITNRAFNSTLSQTMNTEFATDENDLRAQSTDRRMRAQQMAAQSGRSFESCWSALRPVENRATENLGVAAFNRMVEDQPADAPGVDAYADFNTARRQSMELSRACRFGVAATGRVQNRRLTSEQEDQRDELVSTIRNRKPTMTFSTAWETARSQRPDLFGLE